MRPPEHWHLRRPRRPRWLLAAGAVAAALLAGALVFALRPSGGGGPQPGATANECSGGAVCASDGESLTHAGSVAPPKITARAAVVLEQPCAALLYGRNEHLRLPPASLTKIATALVAGERADPDRQVDVRVNSALLVASTASTVMGLEPGLRMSMRDLLYGLLLPSGNDAAIAIAEEVGGSLSGFVELMNAQAAALGLRDSHFTNPHGLDEAGLYTSAYDAALLGRALLAQPELARIVATQRYQPAWDGPELWNGNELLGLYRGEVKGIKIGYTERAGQTMVAAVERDGRSLVISVLGAWDRYADVISLFEWAFTATEQGC